MPQAAAPGVRSAAAPPAPGSSLQAWGSDLHRFRAAERATWPIRRAAVVVLPSQLCNWSAPS
eukprot:15438431-Alexandrium_andersonii.AAC.1